jgi:aryl-alcohol dehydrogenase-like predicted oxidoreductase
LHSPAGPDLLEKEETLEGVHEAFKLGIFEHFGLSNFSSTQVQHVYDVCRDKGFVLPTVYEGLYNPVNRLPEEELFPLLRKLGIAFNAYSVLAGGFLTKTRSHIINGEGRFGKDQYRGLYSEQYNNEAFLQALNDWGAVAEQEGVTRADLAHRWMVHHSALKADLGDGILLGGRFSQLEEMLDGIKRGPLSETAVEKIQGLWERLRPSVKYENNLQAMLAAAAKGGSDRL